MKYGIGKCLYLVCMASYCYFAVFFGKYFYEQSLTGETYELEEEAIPLYRLV